MRIHDQEKIRSDWGYSRNHWTDAWNSRSFDMIKFKRVEREYFNRCIVRYGMFLFSKEVALEVVARCKALRIWIWGIDAFLLFGAGIQPFMEFGSDYSYEDKRSDVWAMATKRILSASEANAELYFEIVMER